MVRLRSPPPSKIFERLRVRAGTDCPDRCLCHGPDEGTVAQLVNEFVDDPYDGCRHAVYVLECKHRRYRSAKKLAFEKRQSERISTPSWVTGASNSGTLIYVGVSKRVCQRIYDHANAKGNGAHFTNVFPPTRILDVSWYPHMADSYDAEKKTAEELRESSPDNVYVFQL